jgi:gamma-glutamyl phosphate reductase
MADAIFARRQEILDANALDVEAALASRHGGLLRRPAQAR